MWSSIPQNRPERRAVAALRDADGHDLIRVHGARANNPQDDRQHLPACIGA